MDVLTCTCVQNDSPRIPTWARKDKSPAYPQHFIQESLLGLVLAVAEEAVCVDIVRVAVQFDVQVVFTLVVLLDGKSNLRGRPAEIHGAHSRFPLWANVGVPQVFLGENTRIIWHTFKVILIHVFKLFLFFCCCWECFKGSGLPPGSFPLGS